MDYKTLRASGIKHIQQLAGHTWTDHNIHDPGITTLEQVCYALTDLSYRIGFPIQDLIAEGGKAAEWFSPAELMTSAPLTIIDLRKLLIDVEGVRNVWVFPENSNYRPRIYFDDTDRSLSLESGGRDSESEALPLVGLYKIFVATSAQVDLDARKKVLEAVRTRYHAHRGLCEDLTSLNLISDEPVKLEAEIEIDAVDDPEFLLAKVFQRVYQYISPSIKFYTLQERLAAGYMIDEIMEGPKLKHGFIDDKELEAFKLRRFLRASDLIRVIMEDPQVHAVRSLEMGGTKVAKPLGDWTLKIPNGRAPVWIPSYGRPGEINTPFVLLREGLPVQLNWKRVEKAFLKLISGDVPKFPPPEKRDIQVKPGKDRSVSKYDAIQLQFPDVYGIGVHGLPKHVPADRSHKAEQLKTYLAFFEQILANYFGQLGHMNQLFSYENNGLNVPHTYSYKSLFSSIPEFEQLLLAMDQLKEEDRIEAKAKYNKLLQQMSENPHAEIEGEEKETALQRNHRFLNHLLARFSEQIADPSLDLFAGTETELSKQEKVEAKQERMIRIKRLFLKEYPQLSSRRGSAFNYTRDAWNTKNISGLQHRISLLLGIENILYNKLATLDENHVGAFYMLEHILLRPRGGIREGDQRQKSAFLLLPPIENEDKPPQRDPYSLQLSFIFPNWLNRFSSDLAKHSIYKVLREETPAHIRIYLRWLDKAQMKIFEKNHQVWLAELNSS